jgi:hypothetical protein
MQPAMNVLNLLSNGGIKNGGIIYAIRIFDLSASFPVLTKEENVTFSFRAGSLAAGRSS